MIEDVVKKAERISEGGNLLANLKLLDNIDTWETSQEVFKAWQDGAPVEGVSTANMAIYRLEDGEAVFDLLGKDGNLFVDERFQQDTYSGIVSNDFFFPNAEMKKHVVDAIVAGKSATVKYSQLRVKTENCGKNFGYVEFDGNNNDEEKKLFKAVYGIDNPGIGKKVYLLREDVVRAQLTERPNDMIARACCLNYDQNFNADDRYIGSYYGAVRGVRRESVAEGDEKKIEAGTPQYTPTGIMEFLRTNPVNDQKFAAALLGAANKFYQRQKQQRLLITSLIFLSSQQKLLVE